MDQSMKMLLDMRDIFAAQVNQSVRYVHSCLELPIQIKLRTNNPSWKMVVLDLLPNRLVDWATKVTLRAQGVTWICLLISYMLVRLDLMQ